ncbi:MAG: TPR Domain containing protein [candidate division TM6 bacterium GW2011_GWF2_30_66]|nr:MAG: TPR Domain containing protein [candidate division TM6 bacterium GW2011_GWF2_30_66]
MEKLGCVLELMFGNILFGEQVGGHIVQKEQLEELNKLGLQCYVNNQAGDAIKYFKQALKVCPRADIYNNLGLVYLNDGDYAKAINSFKSALSVDASYLPSFYNLGVTFHYAKVYDVAAEIFEEILKSSDGLEKDIILSANNDLACALNRKGDVAQAIKILQAALVIDDKFVKAYANLGNIYCGKGMFEEAKAEFDKAIAIDDKCAAAYNGLGVIDVENGKFDSAEKFFDKALEVDRACTAAEVNKSILKKFREKQN